MGVRAAVTTALDAFGLLAVAAGVSGGLYEYIGPWSIAAGGALVMAVSMWWGRTRDGES